jgi:hypothetical protein
MRIISILRQLRLFSVFSARSDIIHPDFLIHTSTASIAANYTTFSAMPSTATHGDLVHGAFSLWTFPKNAAALLWAAFFGKIYIVFESP